MFIFKRSYIDLINELEYCDKWNIVYIINYQIDLCSILFFLLITYGELKNTPKNPKKPGDILIFVFHFAQNMSLNKF